MSGEQAIFNLKIRKKRELSLNPDIHHSKVFSSGYLTFSSNPLFIDWHVRFTNLYLINYVEDIVLC